jgi:hypothetical protein
MSTGAIAPPHAGEVADLMLWLLRIENGRAMEIFGYPLYVLGLGVKTTRPNLGFGVYPSGTIGAASPAADTPVAIGTVQPGTPASNNRVDFPLI